MKTKLLVLTVFTFFAGIFSSAAQENTRLGGMVAYGTEIESIGLGVNAEFPVMENFTIAPSFLYYFPKEEAGIDMEWWELNANANYYFVNNESIGFYGLAGLNYSNVSIDYGGMFGGTADASDGEFGLNLGAGANFEIGSSIIPFAEARYVIIDGGQLVIGAGVKFNL